MSLTSQSPSAPIKSRMEIGDILVPANPGPPGKWSLNGERTDDGGGSGDAKPNSF